MPKIMNILVKIHDVLKLKGKIQLVFKVFVEMKVFLLLLMDKKSLVKDLNMLILKVVSLNVLILKIFVKNLNVMIVMDMDNVLKMGNVFVIFYILGISVKIKIFVIMKLILFVHFY